MERFADDNFAQQFFPSIEDGISEGAMVSIGHSSVSDRYETWRHSLLPLERCLLKRLEGKSDVCEESLISYSFIMRYMGDLPAHPSDYLLNPTDMIFGAPIRHDILRDELYCQLMKQLTFNPNPLSEERGWELLWLCIGLFPPSIGLLPEVQQFLHSRHQHPIARDCSSRLEKAVSVECNRQYPPHQVEVEAIRQRTTQIFHKVFFPDGNAECLEVESSTKVGALVSTIVARLGIRSPAGLNLFAKIGDRVVSMPDSHYFFDTLLGFVHQLPKLVGENGKDEPSSPLSYQIYFMRKLWIDVVPGDDSAADLSLHYNQELPKYIRGYYSLTSTSPDAVMLTREKAVRLAALILKAQTRDDKLPPFYQFSYIVKDVVPRDIVRAISVSEWKRLVLGEFEKLYVGNSAEAKVEFLRELAQFPTFGSAFFEVKQSSDPTMAAREVVAISHKGVSLYNHEGRQHIVTYPFSTITNWQSGNTYFHLMQGNLAKGTRLLLETTLVSFR